MVRVTILSRPTPVIPDPTPAGLELTFDDIANVPVADVSSVSDWNTFFDLPTNGTEFTSVEVVGDMVRLIGGSGITLAEYLFFDNSNLIKWKDYGVITSIGSHCFDGASLVDEWYFAELTTIANGAFFFTFHTLDGGIIYVPKLQNAGSTTGVDGGIFPCSGKIIHLTISSEVMTCDLGDPDGDIALLIANNTVTIVTV